MDVGVRAGGVGVEVSDVWGWGGGDGVRESGWHVHVGKCIHLCHLQV